MFLPDKDERIVSMQKLIADITVSLGGRAAEELVLDDISTGASNDIKQATKVAKAMIKQFGMNEKLGLVEYGDHETSQLGYSYSDSFDYSQKTAELIDSEVREIISESYKNAIKILKNNKAKLDKLAKLLLEKEVVSKEEFEKIF
jgi:cell division protease FtsH